MNSDVKRFLFFTSREWGLFALGIGAVITLGTAFPETWFKIYIFSFAVGFLYEASMDPLFTYHRELRERHCLRETDINFLLPFGWVHIIGASSLLAEKGFVSSSPLSYVAATFLVGSISELFFFHLKYWIYHYDSAYIGNFRPFMPKMTLSGIPVQVFLGYALNGLAVYLITRKMF